MHWGGTTSCSVAARLDELFNEAGDAGEEEGGQHSPLGDPDVADRTFGYTVP